MIGVNLRDSIHTVNGRLFQAAMWRKYANAWYGPLTFSNSWVRLVLGKSRYECLRRARINVRLARRLNRIETKRNTIV